MNDKETLSQAMNDLKKEGYNKEFYFENQLLTDRENNKQYKPEELVIEKTYRFEGMVNPSDMSVLYAIKTQDGQRGTIADSYGVYADQDFSHFMTKVKKLNED